VEIVGGYRRDGGGKERREQMRGRPRGSEETRAGVDAGVSRRWRLRQAPIWVY